MKEPTTQQKECRAVKAFAPHQLGTFGQAFVNDFCTANQIDLSGVNPVRAPGYSSAEWATESIPATGNMSAMIQAVAISFEVFNPTQEDPGIVHACVRWHYTHPGGGSNGYTRRYILHAETRGEVTPIYRGFVDVDLLHNLISEYRKVSDRLSK